MAKTQLDVRDDVAVLRLDNGVVNGIDPALLEDLADALETVREDCRGLVLAGGGKFFSMGFALPELLPLDRPAMSHFFARFNGLCLDLLALPLPTVCAVTGHAVAGGCILAITCDYRFAAEGKTRIGLNELLLGVPVPWLAELMLVRLVGDRQAADLIYRGRLVGAAEAFDMGLVDGVFPPENLIERAIERVVELAAIPRPAFAPMKARRVEAIRSRFEARQAEETAAFLDGWFSGPARERLLEASKKF